MSVDIEDNILRIAIDISNVAPAPLTLNDWMISTTSTLTEVVLTYSDYDELWKTVTVEFGTQGSISNDKSDVKTNSASGRYFDSSKFQIKK